MLSHLLELRRRAIYILAWFSILFLLFFFIANDLFHALISPLLKALPKQSTLIATQITSPLITPLKLSADAALLFSAPFVLYQLWQFISPGLSQKEQAPWPGIMLLSIILFFTGLIFCFYLILPFMFQFFTKALPSGVHFMPDMAYAIDFITHMLLLFGLCFQVPLITLILARCKLLTLQRLKTSRPYVIVGAFIIGMLLTPPDVFSQIMLAIPLCLLYELGIVLVFLFVKQDPCSSSL